MRERKTINGKRKTEKRFLWVAFFVFLVGLTACGGASVPTPTAVPTAIAIVPPTVELPAPLTPTAVPTATDTATPLPSATNTATVTATPTNTATATATETAVPTNTPTPTMPPATSPPVDQPTSPPPPPSSGGVSQPPYAPSACSDKYPCNDDAAAWEARIQVPAGFTAQYFARVEGSPTSITWNPAGTHLFVAVQEGTIYQIDPGGGVSVFTGGYNTPTGIAFQPGTNNLYVASRARNENVGGESKISIVNQGQIIGGLPCCYTFMHAANGIAFGPDGYGYVGVGGRADHGEILDGSNQQDERHPFEASILRFSPDGSVVEVYARGFRNPYDIAWDGNGQLWATDNQPDFGPPEELHRVVPGGEHGYPWFICDGCFAPPPGITIIPPTYTFIPHSSPTGITAYLGGQFPGYTNNLFVALWSSFPGAQKVVRISGGMSNFATGFAAPIDVTVGPAGSLYVADWATGIIFKISYVG